MSYTNEHIPPPPPPGGPMLGGYSRPSSPCSTASSSSYRSLQSTVGDPILRTSAGPLRTSPSSSLAVQGISPAMAMHHGNSGVYPSVAAVGFRGAETQMELDSGAMGLPDAQGQQIQHPHPQAQVQHQQQRPRPQHRQIHRNRASYSCHSCRRRKVKCDRQHPSCGNCSKMVEQCVYSDNTGKGPNKPGKDKLKTLHQQQQHLQAVKATKLDLPTSNGGLKRRRTDNQTYQVPDVTHLEQRVSSAGVSSVNTLQDPFLVEPSLSGSPGSTSSPASSSSANLRNPVPTALKEAELETRVNRLAEIVDQWYKVAYGKTGGQLGPDGPAQLAAHLEATLAPRQTTGCSSSWAAVSPTQAARPAAQPVRRNHTAVTSPSNGVREDDSKQQGSPAYTAAIRAAIAQSNIETKEGEGDDLALGHLSIQEGGRSRYVGCSFWALLSSEITELNQVLTSTHNTQTCPGSTAPGGLSTPPHGQNSPSPDSSNRPLSIQGCGINPPIDKASLLNFEPHGPVSGEDLASLLQSLPPKHLCDRLYASFMTGVHPVMPLIHGPTFDQQYTSFWTWYPDRAHKLPDSELKDNPTFLPLLFAVLYAGAMSIAARVIKNHFDGQSKETITGHLYAATTKALAATEFPRSPTISSLIAFLIVQTCLIREEEPLTTCSFIGMAMRVAQQMGLHRDGSLFNLGEIECEVRRRVWWHIMYLDIQGAIAAGLPPLGGSGEDQFDTKMVSELRDEFIGAPPTGNPTPRCSPSPSSTPSSPNPAHNSKTSPAMILAAGRYETTLLLRKIISCLLGIKAPNKHDLAKMGESIYTLKLKLEARIARIPARGLPELGFIPPTDEAQDEGVFNSWARIMLSMLADRAYGVLYQPFLKSTKSKLWLHARHCALRSSHSFLRKFIHLARSPAFQPFQWFCPGTYQPLHATMILLLDLYERPYAPEAPRSRVFVDEVFALFGEFGNYTTEDGEACPRPLMEGGREAWKMLGRLRRRSYKRCGLEEDSSQTGSGDVERAEIDAMCALVDESEEVVRDQQEVQVEMQDVALGYGQEDEMMLPAEEDEVRLQKELEQLTQGGNAEDFDWKEWDLVFGRFVEVDEFVGGAAGQGDWLDGGEL